MTREEKKRQDARAARKQRLAGTSTPSTPKAEPAAPGSGTPAPASRTAAAPPAAQPRVLTAAIVDPTLADPNASLEMVLFNEKTANPHWVGFVGGEPAFKIAFTAQPADFQANLGKNTFTSAEYARTIKQAVTKIPLTQILKDVNAQVYTAMVNESDAYKALEKQVVAAKTAEFQKRSATVLDDFTNVLGIVVHAQANNFLTESPLKASLFRAMQKVGVANALPVIEEAMVESMENHFDLMFKQAQHWMGLHPEAFAEIKDQVMGSQHRMPVVASTDHVARSQRENSIPTAAGNVPMTTQGGVHPGGERTANTDVSEKERIKNLFALGSRARSHNMFPR